VPRPITASQPARFHHTRVIFSPFGAEPDASLVLTADPWSYLKSHLKRLHKNCKGDNRIRAERALYFSSLAEEFYAAAETTPLPAKATVAYYGVLNLAKCLICVRGTTLGDKVEHHGLSPSSVGGKDIKISKRAKNHINIFHEFSAALNSVVPSQDDIDLGECLSHIPEVHEIAVRLELLPGKRRHLLPIEISILTDTKEQWLFSEMTYKKKQKNRLNIDKLLRGKRQHYFREPRTEDNSIVFRAKRRKRFNWSNFPLKYKNICGEYVNHDIVTLLTKDGYRYYCDLNDPAFRHLAYSFMLMFHLGTISRYNPSGTENLLEGEQRPVISEALALTPRQFLYQIVSRITESVCVVPFANI